MREINFKVYTFDELSEEAKEEAIRNLKDRAYEVWCECDWDDANGTIDEVQKMAGIKCSIDSSSQGHYTRWYKETSEDYESTDEEKFDAFKEKVKAWSAGMWCDFVLQNQIAEAEFDERRSYAGNVAWLLVHFCDWVEQNCIGYLEDDYVELYIELNDIEF